MSAEQPKDAVESEPVENTDKETGSNPEALTDEKLDAVAGGLSFLDGMKTVVKTMNDKGNDP